MDNFKLKTLNNGLKILTVNDPRATLLYLDISLNIGSDLESYEDKSVEIAHFLEHIFATFTSKKYPSAISNNELFATLGVYCNASVIEKNSNYILKVPHEHFDKVLDILFNSIKEFRVDSKIFNQEKHAIKEELNDILNDTWISLDENVNTILYKNHPRSFGEKKRINEVKKAEPKELYNFFNKYYKPSNMVFSVYGNITNNLLNKIESKLSKLPKSCPLDLSNYNFSRENLTKNIVYFTKCTNAESYNLNLTFLVKENYWDINSDIASCILSIFTSDLESIITKRLRTIEGLVYNVDSYLDFDEHTNDMSLLNIQTTVEGKNLQKVLNIILEIINNFKKKYVENIDMVKYKSSLKLEHKDNKTIKKPFTILNFYSHYALWNKKMITYEDYYKILSKITKKQIKTFIEKYFVSENIIVFYGGPKKIELKIPKF